jgi:thymidine kinase
MGKLVFNYGCMGSGKTTAMLTKFDSYKRRGKKPIIVKPCIDNREGNFVGWGITKSRITKYEEPSYYYEDLSSELSKLDFNTLFVDEAQFLTKEQVDQLSDVVDFLDVNVMCFGLRTDFQSHLFPGSKRLFELADDIEEIKSTCECGERKTSINARFDENGEIVTEGTQVEIGGNDKYRAICRRCWKNKVRDKLLKGNET